MKLMQDIARPQIAAFLADCDAETMVAMQPAMEQALSLIANKSPIVEIDGPDGPVTIHGFEGKAGVRMIVGTRNGACCIGWNGLHDLPPGFPDASQGLMWSALDKVVKENGNPSIIISIAMKILGPEGIAHMKAALERAQEHDLEATLVALVTSKEGITPDSVRSAGLFGFITLPPCLEDQMAEAGFTLLREREA